MEVLKRVHIGEFNKFIFMRYTLLVDVTAPHPLDDVPDSPARLSSAPSRMDRRAAMVMIVTSLALLAVSLPFARTPLTPVPAMSPTYESALAIIDLITSVLLFGQFSRTGRMSVLVLASGYLFDTCIVVAHALSFPGVFAPTGLLGATSQTTAWLYVFWHSGFPASALAYALLAGSRWDMGPAGRSRDRARLLGIVGAAAVAAGLTLISTVYVGLLPVVIVGGDYSHMIEIGISPGMLGVTALAIAVLWRRRLASVLDIWLHAVLWAWLCDVSLRAVIGSSRYDLGWYGGRLFGIVAASLVLIALLIELNALHGRLAASLDLAEQRNAALVQSRTELARAQRMEAMGQLTAGVAHDFNNLLTAVMGAPEMIGRRPGDQHRVAMLAETAGKAAARGARLVHQLMTFSRQQNLRPELLYPNAIVTEAEAFARAAVGSARLVLELDQTTYPVRVDPAEFQAALLNLISNARDAMPDSSNVRITTRNIELTVPEADLVPGHYARFAVTDTGEGMSAETRAKAFEPFFTTKPPGSGTGLGLSQVYGLTRSAGGGVVIKSEPKAGTTIELLLPRAAPVPLLAPVRVPVPVRITRAGGQTVLVVEDDPLVMETTTATLQKLGYHTLQATSADAALGILNDKTPVDIVFSDISMPGALSGIDLADAARRVRPELPVLLTSGCAGDGSDQPATFPVLAKPCRRDELSGTLKFALQSAPQSTLTVVGPTRA